MDGVIKLAILYVLNSVAFVIQDILIDSRAEKPLYVVHPSPINLTRAIIVIPFMTLIRPLILGNKVMFIIQLVFTIAIYYYVYTEFSIGFIIYLFFAVNDTSQKR